MSAFAKSSISLKKDFFGKKKSLQLLFADKIFKTVCRIFFSNKSVVSRDLTFGDITVMKNSSSEQNN